MLPLECLAEYDAAAAWCALRGLSGDRGDMLPPLLSAATLAAINEDIEAFARRVADCAYAQAMSRLQSE